MTLGEKLRYLREVEGTLRGLGRPISQSEVARGIREELGEPISQAYLSQVENGRRKHLTETTRMMLARFFNVHPGYLVSDPEGFQTELMSPVRAEENRLDLWLIDGAERFARDPQIRAALLAVARNEDSRRCILLLGALLEMPGMVERLNDVLKPRKPAAPVRKGGKRR
jgi:transcriptional regulator with XRE-family HTH domain